MMGYQTFQLKLCYRVSLEERVPANHLLRQVAEVVDPALAGTAAATDFPPG